jgi:hypothetical protein
MFNKEHRRKKRKLKITNSGCEGDIITNKNRNHKYYKKRVQLESLRNRPKNHIKIHIINKDRSKNDSPET